MVPVKLLGCVIVVGTLSFVGGTVCRSPLSSPHISLSSKLDKEPWSSEAFLLINKLDYLLLNVLGGANRGERFVSISLFDFFVWFSHPVPVWSRCWWGEIGKVYLTGLCDNRGGKLRSLDTKQLAY